MFARALLLSVLAFSVPLATGCEKTDHETIDKWTRTEKGPGKLKKAVLDEGLDPDLSAHAAANVIRMGKDPDVRAALEQLSPPRKAQILDKLAPRLWEMARVEQADAVPTGLPVVAKDALVQLRKHATDAQRTQIDAYLADWYGVISYEKRATLGANVGATVMRLIGPPAAKKLMTVLDAFIAMPEQNGRKVRISDELLLGLAATGSPEGVKYILDVARMDRGDATLGRRALDALRTAYVDPRGLFDLADTAALAPNIPELVAIAKDERMMGRPGNDAIDLLRAVGAPACVEPLVGLIPFPHPEKNFRYAVAYAAIVCGGAAAITPVVQALPEGAYAQDALAGSIVGEIARLTPRDAVLSQLRELLARPGRVPRWVAAEALAAMKSAEDAPRIAALGSSRDRLTGFWGDQSGAAAPKPDPTLGERARQLAAQLAAK